MVGRRRVAAAIYRVYVWRHFLKMHSFSFTTRSAASGTHHRPPTSCRILTLVGGVADIVAVSAAPDLLSGSRTTSLPRSTAIGDPLGHSYSCVRTASMGPHARHGTRKQPRSRTPRPTHGSDFTDPSVSAHTDSKCDSKMQSSLIRGAPAAAAWVRPISWASEPPARRPSWARRTCRRYQWWLRCDLLWKWRHNSPSR